MRTIGPDINFESELAKADPAAGLGQIADPDSVEAQRVLGALLVEAATTTGAAASTPSRWTEQRLLVGLAAAGLAAIAAFLAISFGSEDSILGPKSAQAALERLSLAASAAEQDEPVPEDGQYYYRRQVGYGGRESWVGQDGKGGYRSAQLFNGRLRLTDAQDNLISVGPQDEVTYRELLDLPRDPARLYAYFAERAGFDIPPGTSDFETEQIQNEDAETPENQRMFFTISDMFVQAPLPPDLRVSLFEVLKRIDGIQLLGRVTNEAGEEGIGIGMFRGVDGTDDPDAPIAVDGTPVTSREDLIFDQRTGQLIGYRSGNPGSQEGAAFTETAVVDRIGERP